MAYHELLCIRSDLKQLSDGVHEALVVEVAHLLDLAVMVAYPGIQLLHEALVGVGLVIVDRSDKRERKRERQKQSVALKKSFLSCCCIMQSKARELLRERMRQDPNTFVIKRRAAFQIGGFPKGHTRWGRTKSSNIHFLAFWLYCDRTVKVTQTGSEAHEL